MPARTHSKKHRDEALKLITDEGFNIVDTEMTKNAHVKATVEFKGQRLKMTVPISGLANRGRLNFRAQVRRARQRIEDEAPCPAQRGAQRQYTEK